ncbi:MAG: polyprenyl synthetase family protein [Solirubrobacterales bacterium]
MPPPVTEAIEVASAWLPARMAEVEAVLGRSAGDHGSALADDATATLTAGGKRLRPLLVLLCAGPGCGEAAVRAAASVELVHMATLVHDDVLDAAPLRRGRPTVAATSGRDAASAVGDLLFSRAFALLGSARDERAVGLLADASVSLARGELMQRGDAFDLGLSEERYLRRCSLKTARLFECACRIGRPGAGADAELRAFGSGIGLAFQLLDDVLDVSGPPEKTGKARGTDLLDGTVTLPLIRALRRDPALGEVGLEGLTPEGAESICERIAAAGALGEVRVEALALVGRAKRAIAAGGLDAEQRRLLELVADGVVERYA